MRSAVWFFALVAVAFVALHAGFRSAEMKAAADTMNIAEMQTAAHKNMPTTVIKDPF